MAIDATACDAPVQKSSSKSGKGVNKKRAVANQGKG